MMTKICLVYQAKAEIITHSTKPHPMIESRVGGHYETLEYLSVGPGVEP